MRHFLNGAIAEIWMRCVGMQANARGPRPRRGPARHFSGSAPEKDAVCSDGRYDGWPGVRKALRERPQVDWPIGDFRLGRVRGDIVVFPGPGGRAHSECVVNKKS